MFGKRTIYLDHAAATPVDPRVLRAMRPYVSKIYANPGGLHAPALMAQDAVSTARATIARSLGVRSQEIVFTASGSESNTLAIVGAIRAYVRQFPNTTPHVIATAIEHKSVLAVVQRLATIGEIELSIAPVDSDGMVQLKEFKKLLRSNTALVSVMYANNEVGTIQPIKEIAKLIRHTRKHITGTQYPLLHSDAIQAFNYCSMHAPSLGVDLMSISAAKIYGPKGIAALYIKTGVIIEPIIYGGGQEHGLRAGTENVPLIVGFETAVTIADNLRERESARLHVLQDYFFEQLQKIGNVRINGSRAQRLPNNVNVTFGGISGEQLVIELDARSIAVSAQSACTSEDEESSYVIKALYPNANTEDGGVRFSMGRTTTKRDIDRGIRELRIILERIRVTQRMLQS